MLRLDVVFLLPGGACLEVRTAYPPEDELDAADLGAAKWAFESGRPAGRGSDTLAGARRLFLPIAAGNRTLGVVGLTRARPGLLLTPGERRLLDALGDQIAVALERMQLVRSMAEARIGAETERLRSAVLASLSHDLKTPLAAITGAATSLQNYPDLFDRSERDELTAVIAGESGRLMRYVTNLLDMTRLEAGAIELRREPVEISEVVATAVSRSAGALGSRKVEVDIPQDLPLLSLDVVLFEQVLANLLENTGRHTRAEAAITVRATRVAAAVAIEVLDEGPGIPVADLERIFEKFQRSASTSTDGRSRGVGLGLAICRGFVEALGGTIRAENRADRSGARFTIQFPEALIVPSAEIGDGQ